MGYGLFAVGYGKWAVTGTLTIRTIRAMDSAPAYGLLIRSE
jgi:hypothetical protein